MKYVALDFVAVMCVVAAFVQAWRQRGRENIRARALQKLNRYYA